MSVALVGAGPGDPGLITVRGLERVRAAEVLVYDRLVAAELVAEAPGMKVPRGSLPQHEINDILVRHGRRRRVVRLKGGDPFVFGRGGEEALALVRAGIAFEVIPGVSALAAVPAAAGIPLTHRGLSAQVTIVTGHAADGSDLDFAALARVHGTLVVFMGLEAVPVLAHNLIAHGADPQLPTAVVSRGTREDQEVVHAPLAELGEASRGLATPALLVLGHVVELAALLAPLQPLAEAAVT
ncbi:MAG TPA: uroporphyrinogen-III C-methyltransferase [Gaiellaceae bacterium]|jgi:uroporphyrin-III C-methyltransferase|nr:uroporphyrinogen-III C-methyltransferase [Gaiellaceae bacterium]